MIGNALVRRYSVSALRPQHLVINVGVFVIGLALICVLNALALQYGSAYNGETTRCLRSVYGQLLAIQFLLLWGWGGFSAGSALREEMLHKSYDFFRLLPLSPWQKLVGIALGRNLLALALTAVTAILQLGVGLAGEVPVFLQAQVAFALVSTTALVWCVVVLSSVQPRKGRQQQRGMLALLIIFFALFGLPLLLRLIVLTSSVTEIQNWDVSFFSVDLPGMLLVGVIAACFAIWAAFGAIRRLNRSDLTLFSPAGAYGFLACCLVIALGLFYEKLTDGGTGMWLVYAAVTQALVFLIPFGLLRSYDQYMELTYDLAQKHGGVNVLGRKFLTATSPVTWTWLYLLWASFTIGAALITSLDLALWSLALIACLFFAWAVLMLLAEVAVVGAPQNEKLKFFAGFLGVLYVFLPILLSVVLSLPGIGAFSYFGVWAEIGRQSSEGNANPSMLILPSLLNILILAVLALVIRHRYAGIVELRRSMLARNADAPQSL